MMRLLKELVFAASALTFSDAPCRLVLLITFFFVRGGNGLVSGAFGDLVNL